jgi:hypothetical protein
MSETKTFGVLSVLSYDDSFEKLEQNVGRHNVGRCPQKTKSVDSRIGEIGSRKYSHDPDSCHRNQKAHSQR